MVPHHFVYQLVLFALIWLFVVMHLTRPKRAVIAPATPALPEHWRELFVERLSRLANRE